MTKILACANSKHLQTPKNKREPKTEACFGKGRKHCGKRTKCLILRVMKTGMYGKGFSLTYIKRIGENIKSYIIIIF